MASRHEHTDPIAPLPRVAQPKALKNVAAVPRRVGAAPPPSAQAPRPSPQRPKPAAMRTPKLALAGTLPPARIPPESLVTPRRVSVIGVAIGFSIVLHALALTLHFTTGTTRGHDPNPPLEVALVNAKSAAKPTKADLLAQANLDGGGNTEHSRRAKT